VARRLLIGPGMNNTLRISLLLTGVVFGAALALGLGVRPSVSESAAACREAEPPSAHTRTAYLVDVYLIRPGQAPYALRLGAEDLGCALVTDGDRDEERELKVCPRLEADGAVALTVEASLHQRSREDVVRQRFELGGRLAPDGQPHTLGSVSSPDAPLVLQVALRPQGGENTETPLFGPASAERK
jgi:hypothetical protein